MLRITRLFPHRACTENNELIAIRTACEFYGWHEVFEDGFHTVYEARKDCVTDYPISVWYALKQSGSDDWDSFQRLETLPEG